MALEEKINQKNQEAENTSAGNGTGGNDTTASKESDNDRIDHSLDDNEQGNKEQINTDISGSELSPEDTTGNEPEGDNGAGNKLDGDDISGNELTDELTDDLTGNELDDDLTGSELTDDLTGNELDDDFTGNELTDDLTGNELEEDLTGNELSDNLTDNELDGDLTGNKLAGDQTGNELDELDNTGNGASQDAVAAKVAEGQAEAKPHDEKPDAETQTNKARSSRLTFSRKIILPVAAAILLCVAAGVAFVLWPTPPEIELETAEVHAPETGEILPVSMDAFLIPFSLGKFSYISLNVSIEVPTGRIRNEIIAQKDLIRGQIYELLSEYARDLANAPVPNDIKTIISKSINESLSNGNVRELYLTQFIVI